MQKYIVVYNLHKWFQIEYTIDYTITLNFNIFLLSENIDSIHNRLRYSS